MTASKRLTHKQRLDLINAPFPIVANYRIVHPQKRWGGVFVCDTFGESEAAAIARNRRKHWVGGVDAEGVNGHGRPRNEEPVTQYDSNFYLADVALWERIVLEEVASVD